MPKLLYASSSPYSSKVRMAAVRAGIDVENVAVETAAEPAILIDANPLGKIPTWIADDGLAIFDSRVIVQYLDRESGGKLYPKKSGKRTGAERLEAIADGIADCALAHVYERRSRPQNLVHQPWLDKQWTKIERGLDLLKANPPKLGGKVNAGHLALRATLGYLALRFAGKWEKGRGKLTRWAAKFDEKYPELKPLLPM